MTYWLLNLAFLGTVALVALVTWLSRRMPVWRRVAACAIPLLAMTAIFDNVLVGTRIVSYDADLVSGVRLGFAPIEDFSYAIAAVVLLPCLWSLLAPNSSAPNSSAPNSSGANSSGAGRSSERGRSNQRVRVRTPREATAAADVGEAAELPPEPGSEPTP